MRNDDEAMDGRGRDGAGRRSRRPDGAGAGDITDLLNAPKPANVFFPQMFGAGQIADIDDAVWNSAGVDAIHRAREQAATLAAAAGRGLGDVTQITFLTKTVKGGDANVIVAVRFALVAGKAQ